MPKFEIDRSKPSLTLSDIGHVDRPVSVMEIHVLRLRFGKNLGTVIARALAQTPSTPKKLALK